MCNKRDSSTSRKALRGLTWTWPMDSRSQVNDKDLYNFPRPIKLVIFRISASWWLPTTKTADCGDWARAEERWSRRAVGPTPGRWHWSLIVISLISSTLFPSISCFALTSQLLFHPPLPNSLPTVFPIIWLCTFTSWSIFIDGVI